MLYRTSLSLPAIKPSIPAPDDSIASALTESQKSANKILLESASDQDLQIETLLADIVSLENAVRQQVAQRAELESTVQQQAALHTQQLSAAINNLQLNLEKQNSEHDQESQQLRKRLAEAERRNSDQNQKSRERLVAAEKLIAEQKELVSAGTAEAHQLRKLLAGSDAAIISRDDEIVELRLQLDACEQRHATRLSEAEHEHAAESKHLRAIASLAENRAIERKGLIAKLESELTSRNEKHATELAQLRDSFEIERQRANAIASAASDRDQIQASEIDELKTHVQLLKEEHEVQCKRLQAARHAREADQLEFKQNAVQHSIESQNLNSKIDQLQVDLERSLAENSLLETAAEQNASERSAAIAAFKQQLAAARADAQQSNLSALKLRQQSVTFHTTIDRLTKAAVERESSHESEIEKLRTAIERTQDAAIDQLREAKNTESVLRAQRHTLEKSVERLNSEAAENRTRHQVNISSLQQLIKDHRAEIELLASEAEQAARELDRKEGALQRVQSKNERLLEIHDSQFPLMQSRIDELVVALDIETDKRKTAETEARRLGATRSRRLAFLGAQREHLLVQTSQLRSENQLLRAKGHQLRNVLETNEWSLEKATNGLRAQASEIRQLRRRLEAATTAESEELRQRLEKHAASVRETVRLNMLLDETRLELQACRQQLTRQPTEEGPDETESEEIRFTSAQRDRTIALLENESEMLQARLRKEAAARRKAEGVIKRKVKAENVDPAVQDAWSHIDASEQFLRLKRQITALENVGLLERQRAATEISRYKKHIKQLRQQFGNRAA